MSLRSTDVRWGPVTQALHWTFVVLLAFQVSWGLWMTTLPLGVHKVKVYALHKSVGLTLLALACMRVTWRLFFERRPAMPPMPAWQRRAALTVHVLIYLLLFALPLSGWLYNSLAGFPLRWFDTLHVPALHDSDPALKGVVRDLHETLAWVLVTLVALHAAAAIKHHYLDRDHTLASMIPGLRPKLPRPGVPPDA
jgi:cytochrome b561